MLHQPLDKNAMAHAVCHRYRIRWRCLGNVTFLMLIAAVVSGCGNTVVSRQPIGKIVDANVVPTSWNETTKMTIKCENRVIVLHRIIPSVPVGEEATLVSMSDGSQWITWQSAGKAWRVP